MLRNCVCLSRTALQVCRKNVIQNQIRQSSIFGSSKASEWNKAVSDAERIVGYPTSFMSLRCLLSDELSNVALQMRKLVGTKHPLLKTARRFIYDGKHSLQTRGLLILLISKAAGPSRYKSEDDVIENMVSGIYPSQRTLAEITEMIHTAYLVHRGVINLSSLKPSDGSVDDMHFGNKMAVLSGDFLLANASSGLAELYNTYVVEVMSSAIRDLMAAEFSKLRDTDGQHHLPAGGSTISDWEEQTYLSSGSLVAKGCQGAMMLANHPENMQNKAYDFGKQIAYVNQLREDLQPVEKGSEEVFSLTSAPVILHLQQQQNDDITTLLRHPIPNHRQILRLLTDSGSIAEARQLCQEYGQRALVCLDIFPDSEARDALQNIVHAATTFS